MFAEERQKQIREMLQKNGAVTTKHLVQAFGVSIETVRRDLLLMEEAGLLNRVHGGAVATGGMKPYYELPRRNREHSEKKRELSEIAMSFISEGDYIGIDAGSTAAIFAEVLKEHFNNLTVVTHSSDVFETLRESFTVILCGGTYLREENAFYGALTLQTMESLHVQKSFIFPSAVSLQFGICDYQQDLFAPQKKLLEIADEAYILADSSKFESRALLKLDDMKPEYCYVTDGALGEDLKALYKENQLRVLTKAIKGDK
ncbi:MAG: DeoR/GlpR transcriptional regulator [Clostridia bacterium]|nr:DeoR/GlpR transcriptional regulator [Clostridia bacterium]